MLESQEMVSLKKKIAFINKKELKNHFHILLLYSFFTKTNLP